MSKSTDRREELSVFAIIGVLVAAAVLVVFVPPLFSQPTQGAETMDEAVDIAQDFLVLTGDKDLAIDRVVEFRNGFYVAYYERSTGIGAFEMQIDKPGALRMMWIQGLYDIRPEQGPNMMWNTKYGQMMGWSSGVVFKGAVIEADQAKGYAQGYVDSHLAGAKVLEIRPFYGYYTVDVGMDGKTYGMLSVNAYTGQIWYHVWNGEYIDTRSFG